MTPGNTDDKSFEFSTSNLGFLKPGFSKKKEVLRKKAIEQCETARCIFRTSERITAFTNYPIYSVVFNFIYRILPSKVSFLRKVSLTYSLGFLFLFILSLAILIIYVFKSVNENHNNFIFALLSIFLYSGILGFNSYLNDILAIIFTNVKISTYSPIIYVPRGPQAIFFLIALFAFIENKNYLMFLMLPLITLTHVGQAPFYLLLIFIILLIYHAKYREEAKNFFINIICVVALGIFSACWTLIHYESTPASDVFNNFLVSKYFSIDVLKRSLLFLAIFIPFLFTKKKSLNFRIFISGLTLYFCTEALNIMAYGINNELNDQSSLEQLPHRIGTPLYTALSGLAFISLFQCLQISRFKKNLLIFSTCFFLFLNFATSYQNFPNKLLLNTKSFYTDMDQEFLRNQYSEDDYKKLNLDHLRPNDEVLFHLFMYEYF